MIKIPQIPPQPTPALDDRAGDPSLPSLVARTWYLFFNAVVNSMSAMLTELLRIAALDFVFGGSKLTTIGSIPKITAAGVLGESSLADDGAFVSGTEPLHLDTGAAPADSQVALSANALGALELLCYQADLCEILFDIKYIGAALIARNAKISRISKIGGKLNFHYGFGQTVGSPISDAVSATLDLATGKWGFLNASPAEVVDVTGNVNATGVYKKGGTSGISTTAVLAKLTSLGSNGSLTISGGIITAYTAPT